MARDVSGNYTLPAGNPVANGTVIDILWANPTMADIAVQLNNVFTRDGVLGPLAPFKLVDGSSAAPGLSFNNQVGTGLWNAAASAGFSFRGTTHFSSAAGLLSFSVPVAGTSMSLSSTLAVTGAITATGGVVGNVTGNLTGNVTGNLTGNVTGNTSGSAGSVAWTNVSGRPTDLISFTNSTNYITAAGAPVQSVAGRSGAVLLTKADVGLSSAEDKSSATIRSEISSLNVTTALGFTPYNATNPNGYIAAGGAPVQSVAGRTGIVTLSAADVGLAAVENKSSATIRSEITSLNVTTALGFTPYNATNPNGYIAAGGAPVQSVAGRTGSVLLTSADVGLAAVENKSSATIRSEINSTNVTNALGYTPYNGMSNPSGYITSSALSPYAVLASAPTFTGMVKGNSGSKGFGAITTTTSTAAPTGGSSGDFHLIY